ncbi:ribulokinase [Lysinibacter sp. HNR]|uniref:ribulokinase n=1 Tax=Lysinibacter sp. HNR TaxID=3031408 RepID=UPI0024347F2F|nr:ribulokinase [Lysinibacter sp. HNR]WGD37710.1 ribulokinase [Lysinibacter sp. HNR]
MTNTQNNLSPHQDTDCVIGIDFGTLSARALVVRVSDGAELGTAVHEYQHGVMDSIFTPNGTALPPDWALQVPNDYIEALKNAVPAAILDANVHPDNVIGIGTDFTACTVLPVDAQGTPLCEIPRFTDRPHAYVKLWKHHAAQRQADRITVLAAERGDAWLQRYGGRISSEWEFAKGLQLLEEDPEVYDATRHWIEAADWIVWQLTGRYTRNTCSAGYKGMLQDDSYPGKNFLGTLNPQFASFAETKVAHHLGEPGSIAGFLTAEAAEWTGLSEGTVVCVGNVDAHVTAPAAQAVHPGQMVAIMGTSTCHIMSAEHLKTVPGMCGVVPGGIVPGLYGYEAGQSGVGDIFAWYVHTHVPQRYHDEAAERGLSIHQHLTELSEAWPVGSHGLIALDWHSGNRSVLVDHELSGLILGSTLTTSAVDCFRALLESTAFGTRMIVETFIEAGVPVTEFIAAGGLTRNAPLMQIYSDVLQMPISILASDQGPALGSAIYAAVAAGSYASVQEAAAVMGRVHRSVYTPRPEVTGIYDRLYAEYRRLHDHFGRGAHGIMHRLKELRREVTA